MIKESRTNSENGGGQIIIPINPKIYPLDVIYSAAYVFLDNFYIIIDGDPNKMVTVKIFPKDSSNPNKKDIGKEFNNELVNYAFYKKQVEKNADIRKAIIQRALVTTELSGEPVADDSVSQSQESPEIEEFKDSDADFIEDPEGIAIPWEEKFGKKATKKQRKSDKNEC